MADEWIECTLADACASIDYGLTASASDDQTGPRFLRITDIVSGHIDWNAVPHVASDDRTTTKYRLHDGDIVLARTGASTGASAYVKEPPPAVFASYLVRLQAKPAFDARFLAYYLKSDHFWTFIRGVLGDKSAQPNASASTMTKAPLRAPKDKEHQRVIAHILGTLDDKIELNRRMNVTIEAIARALFKSWFVDFDPVRAKAAGRDPGLPKPLADLFPSRFVDSELGDIPEGWEVRSFGELLSDSIGGDWGKDEPAPEHTEPIAVVRGTDIPALRAGGTGAVPVRYTTVRKLVRRRLEDGDIVIEVSGGSPTQPTGRSMLVTQDILDRFPCDVVCASFCRRFRPNSKHEALFASQHLSYLYDTGGTWAYQNQSTGISNFQTTHFLEAERLVWPGPSVTEAFARQVGPMLQRQAMNQSVTLGAIRNTLLPKLISGELRVEAAQHFMRECV